jgi:hypothetical protein
MPDEHSLIEIQQAHSLTEGIRIQREALKQLMSEPMARLAKLCANTNMSENDLEAVLVGAFPEIPNCMHLFVLDDQFIQISKNITRDGVDASHVGRDRSGRPYVVNIIGRTEFKLSEAYISRRMKRPSLTAMHVIRNEQNDILGLLGGDFDMRELPHTGLCYKEPDDWSQLKGDSSIRRNLFFQQRVDSIMDDHIDEALETMHELMINYGVFHGEIYFSRSRATIWHSKNPYTYHILTVNELTTPNILLAYPKQSYFDRARVPVDQIRLVFDMFKKLRFADDNVYLRSATLNVVNAMVGLNFSCDGTHYMRFDEFLEKDIDFWFGSVRAE